MELQSKKQKVLPFFLQPFIREGMKHHPLVILKCPDCQCKFEIEAGALGPSGKKVRCSECGCKWFQSLEDVGDSSSFLKNVPENFSEKSLRSLSKIESPAIERPPLFQEDKAFKIDVALENEAIENQASSSSKFVFFLLLVSVLLATLFFLRNTIVQMIPVARPFYEKVGIPIQVVEGFELRATRWRLQKSEDGSQMVFIRGEMVNASTRVLKLPLVQMTMRGTGKCMPLGMMEKLFKKESMNGICTLDKRTLEVGKSRILPGQVIPFEAAYPSDGDNKVTEILLKFKPSEES